MVFEGRFAGVEQFKFGQKLGFFLYEFHFVGLNYFSTKKNEVK